MRDSALLLLFAVRHYGYQHLQPQLWGDVFAISGAACLIALVLMVKPWLPLAAWIIGEEALVAGCSALWLAYPWPMLGEAEQCSAQTGLKLGSIGLAALALLAHRYTLSDLTGIAREKGASK